MTNEFLEVRRSSRDDKTKAVDVEIETSINQYKSNLPTEFYDMIKDQANIIKSLD